MYLDTEGRGEAPKPKTLSGLLPHTLSNQSINLYDTAVPYVRTTVADGWDMSEPWTPV